MEEDLVETTDQDQGPARLVQSLEDRAGGGGGGLDPAMNGGATGTRRRAQKDGQQGQDLVEAQAHGQGRDGELLLLGQGELDGLEQPVPELGVLAAEDFVLLDQFLSGGSAAVLGLDGGQDLLGMVVDALAATAGLLGRRGDRAVGPIQRAAALAIQPTKGMVRMGMGPLGCRSVHNPTLEVHPQRIKRGLVESCQVSTWKCHFRPREFRAVAARARCPMIGPKARDLLVETHPRE